MQQQSLQVYYAFHDSYGKTLLKQVSMEFIACHK